MSLLPIGVTYDSIFLRNQFLVEEPCAVRFEAGLDVFDAFEGLLDSS